MATRQRIYRIEYSPEIRHFGRIRVLIDIRQPGLLRLARLVDIRKPGLLGLPRLAKGKFGKFYANVANLASSANLSSVG
jgi:hypothetical protein